jgi:3-deoxy-D-manno-octulosonic-acid transferase
MYLAYSLLFTIGFLFLVPYFLFQALTHGKYLEGLRQRLGSLDGLQLPPRPVIWLHCVSVGETQAARPLVDRLLKEFPEYSLVVSTTTATGQNLARNVFGSKADAVIYFPFDWSWSVHRALRKVRPSVVLIMETELWPNFLRACDKQDIPVAVVNGRISKQSFRRYSLVRFFITDILSHVTLAVMQSQKDGERIAALGLPTERLRVSGNLKFDVDHGSDKVEVTADLKQRFGFDNELPVILAASTHHPEEKILVDSFKKLQETTSVRLVIAPRHPERFEDVAKLIETSGLSWSRRTDPGDSKDRDVDVVLLNTIGELQAVYPLATIVFVGGSIIDRGGHNVLEPAAAGTCVVTGAHTHNFHAIVDLLIEADALVQLHPVDPENAASTVTTELKHLLEKRERRVELATNATRIIVENRGTADRTIEMIRPLFMSSPDSK